MYRTLLNQGLEWSEICLVRLFVYTQILGINIFWLWAEFPEELAWSSSWGSSPLRRRPRLSQVHTYECSILVHVRTHGSENLGNYSGLRREPVSEGWIPPQHKKRGGRLFEQRSTSDARDSSAARSHERPPVVQTERKRRV